MTFKKYFDDIRNELKAGEQNLEAQSDPDDEGGVTEPMEDDEGVEEDADPVPETVNVVQEARNAYSEMKDFLSFAKNKKFNSAKRKIGGMMRAASLVKGFFSQEDNKAAKRITQELNAYMSDSEVIVKALESGDLYLPHDFDARLYNLLIAIEQYDPDLD